MTQDRASAPEGPGPRRPCGHRRRDVLPARFEPAGPRAKGPLPVLRQGEPTDAPPDIETAFAPSTEAAFSPSAAADLAGRDGYGDDPGQGARPSRTVDVSGHYGVERISGLAGRRPGRTGHSRRSRGRQGHEGGPLFHHERAPHAGGRGGVAPHVRGHWSIENRSHYVRDVDLRRGREPGPEVIGPASDGGDPECDHRAFRARRVSTNIAEALRRNAARVDDLFAKLGILKQGMALYFPQGVLTSAALSAQIVQAYRTLSQSESSRSKPSWTSIQISSVKNVARPLPEISSVLVTRTGQDRGVKHTLWGSFPIFIKVRPFSIEFSL